MTEVVPQGIETARLTLRQFRESDWSDLQAYYGDAEATAHTVKRGLSEGETWRMVATMAGHWRLRGFGPYAVEEKASGTVLGLAGFWHPNDWPAPEIKYALARPYWGKGFASEAVRALHGTWRDCFPEAPLISFIHHENAASIRLARAVGAVFDKEVPFRGSTWCIYRYP